MRQHATELIITSPGQGLHEFTRDVVNWIASTGIEQGLLTLFIRHTSASLLIQENAAPAARRDMERYFARIAPEGCKGGRVGGLRGRFPVSLTTSPGRPDRAAGGRRQRS
jgi:secondary thiamine-phosphate synthase enzyme